MKKNIILIILLSAVFCVQTKAQDGTVFPEISDKIRSNNEKLNLNTGAVNLSVPIWDAEQYGLHIPVSVSFNGNGIKANDTKKLLGTWSLNVGGSISVEQRGLYDREDEGDALLGSGFYYSGNLVDDIPLSLQFALNSVHKRNDKYSDTEPDIFYYNFPGASGKFVYNNSGELINLTDKSLKIFYDKKENGITDDEIYITGNNGIKYYFKCTGYTEDSEGVKSSPVFSLYKTEDLNSDNFIEIRFQESETVFDANYSYKAKYIDNCESSVTFYSDETSHYQIHQTCVKTIETTTEKLDFILHEADSNWDGELNIMISLKKDNTFKPYMRYRFIKSNFFGKNALSRIVAEYNINFNSDSSEIIWKSKDEGYKFQYQGGMGGVDFWGYNNGKTNDINSIETYEPSKGGIMQLNKIIFPKGNSTEYEFELNKFSPEFEFPYSAGAGLRVRKITEKDEHEKIVSVTEYGYADDDFGSFSGKLTTPPVYNISYTATVKMSDNSVHYGNLTTISSSPFMLGASYVNYSGVIEYIGGKGKTGNGVNGRIEYTFKNESSTIFNNYSEEPDIKELFGDNGVFINPTGYNVYKKAADIEGFSGMYVSFEYKFPYKLYVDKADINGLLEKKTVFNNLNKKISETEYLYDITENPICTGFRVFDYLPVFDCYFINADNETYYHGITFYKLFEHKIKLNKITSRIFDKDDETKVNETYTTFDYSEDAGGNLIIDLPVKEETVQSNGDTVSILNYYPHNYTEQSTITNLMKSRHIKTELIKTETYKNNELLAGQNTVYRLKPAGTGQIIVPDYLQTFEDGNYITVKWFDKYTDKGNLIESHGIDGIPGSVILGYDENLTKASVVNAHYNDVFYTSFEEDTGEHIIEGDACTGNKSYDGAFHLDAPAHNQTYILSYLKKNTTGWEYVERELPYNPDGYTVDDGQIDELRLYPINAYMTTKTYDASYKLTSETDANGISSYYEYDNFGRLIKIYDQDRKLIKQNQYHTADLSKLFLNPLTYTTEVVNGKTTVTVKAFVIGGSSPYSYNWDINPPSPVFPHNFDYVKFLTQPNVTYTVTCTVTDANNDSVSKTISFKIQE